MSSYQKKPLEQTLKEIETKNMMARVMIESMQPRIQQEFLSEGHMYVFQNKLPPEKLLETLFLMKITPDFVCQIIETAKKVEIEARNTSQSFSQTIYDVMRKAGVEEIVQGIGCLNYCYLTAAIESIGRHYCQYHGLTKYEEKENKIKKRRIHVDKLEMLTGIDIINQILDKPTTIKNPKIIIEQYTKNE